MKSKLKYLLFFLIFFLIPSTIFAKHDEWAANFGYEFEYPLNERLDFTFAVEPRIKDDFKRLYYYHFQPELTYKFTDFLDFGLGYRYIKQKKIKRDKDTWSEEHRLLFDPKLKWEFAGLKFSNLFRFELRYFDLVGDNWRYRNKLKISKKTRLWGFEYVPFVADEVFYDLRDDKCTQNRFDLGFEKEMSKNVKLTLFYRIQSDKQGRDWSEMHVIGIKFGILLGGKEK